MGAPSQSLCEALTDRLAALMEADLSGMQAKQLANTELSMFETVDASGDPDVEAALISQSVAVDKMALAEQASTNLAVVLQQQAYRDWLFALNALVTSASGGGYASLHAYLLNKAVVLHPLVKELSQVTMGAGALLNGTDVTQVFAPAYQSLAPDRVYTGADGALVDDTTDWGDAGAGDVPLFASDNHCLYIGSIRRFTQVIAALSTLASADVVLTMEYWNGSAWATLPGATDTSAGLTRHLLVRWTLPTDWSRCSRDASDAAFSDTSPLYYIRLTRTANTVATTPVAVKGCIVPTILTGPSGGGQLGLPQPPLAIMRITGANAWEVTPVAGVGYDQFMEPAIALRVLAAPGADLTPTIAYVNQDGADASEAQAAWTSPTLDDTIPVTLDGSDTGVRSIRDTGNAITTTATDGIFEAYVPLVRMPAR